MMRVLPYLRRLWSPARLSKEQADLLATIKFPCC